MVQCHSARPRLGVLVAGTIAAFMCLMSGMPCAADTTVFSTDFESGLPAQFSAPGSVIQGVQGYAGLGPSGNQFSGSFLRYTSVPLFDTQLSLTGLPAHDHLSLKFLLAVIDFAPCADERKSSSRVPANGCGLQALQVLHAD